MLFLHHPRTMRLNSRVCVWALPSIMITKSVNYDSTLHLRKTIQFARVFAHSESICQANSEKRFSPSLGHRMCCMEIAPRRSSPLTLFISAKSRRRLHFRYALARSPDSSFSIFLWSRLICLCVCVPNFILPTERVSDKTCVYIYKIRREKKFPVRKVEWIWWQFSFPSKHQKNVERERMKFGCMWIFQPLIHLGDVIGFEVRTGNCWRTLTNGGGAGPKSIFTKWSGKHQSLL